MENIENSDVTLPLIVTSDGRDATLEDWMDLHSEAVPSLLSRHKALLFRGFVHPAGLNKISTLFFKERLAYTYKSTPRVNLGESIYTATEYPKQLSIPQHCENAYQHSWPMKLLFHCVEPSVKGGRTPLTDMIKVTQSIDPEIKKEFSHRKIQYVRNYRVGADLPWEEVFNTKNKENVEYFCRQNKIDYQWTETGLRTSQICQALATHPVTGDEVWFNQAHLFHISALGTADQEAMLSFFKEEGLPRNAYFGDGGPIDPIILSNVNSAFEKHKVYFDWRKDDLLLIDNMLVSHGREPYEGSRKLFVCMAEPYSATS